MNLPIPNSLLGFAASGFVVGIVMVLIQSLGKKDKWDKIGAWFAIIGGFGIGGIAAGYYGALLSTVWTTITDKGGKFFHAALGTSAVFGILGACVLWAASRLSKKGKGIDSKSRFRSLMVVFALGVVGTGIAMALGDLYLLIDDGMNTIGNFIG